MEITVLGTALQLLPEKAIYIESLQMLLVSDVHLGKSETNQVNQDSLDRLQALCLKLQPKTLIILGDLFHSRFALVPEVMDQWLHFLNAIQLNTVKVEVKLIVGNHDRSLTHRLNDLSIECCSDALQFDRLVLSHEPCPTLKTLNICGHIHPCVRLKTKLDDLRLPCFHLERSNHLLVLPSFGAFTGGYEVSLKSDAIAYVIAENTIVPFEG
jgi:uncharacterized protein